MAKTLDNTREIISQLLSTERDDVLSVYLNVDPTRPENQTSPPSYRIWLKSALADLEEKLSQDNGLPREKRLALRELKETVVEYVNNYIPQGRTLIIFAAPDFWREFAPMARIGKNYVHFGKPDVVPFLWLLDEYSPVGIVLVDNFQARFLSAHLGKASIYEETQLELDIKSWPRYDLRASTLRGLPLKGSNVDAFADRLAEKIGSFWREVAEKIEDWVEEEKFSYLLLGGEDKAVSGVKENLSPRTASRIVEGFIAPINASEHEILMRAKPLLTQVEREREERLLQQAIESALSGGLGALGPADVLNTLKEGRAYTLLVSWPVRGEVYWCPQCDFFFTQETETCSLCRGPIKKLSLREVIPRLAFEHKAKVEIMAGGPGKRLLEYGGMAALLRY